MIKTFQHKKGLAVKVFFIDSNVPTQESSKINHRYVRIEWQSGGSGLRNKNNRESISRKVNVNAVKHENIICRTLDAGLSRSFH